VGRLFESKEQTEYHRLELGKEWIDKQSQFSGDDEGIKRLA
jgi:hypothetical protein